jgi:hypothetical protein
MEAKGNTVNEEEEKGDRIMVMLTSKLDGEGALTWNSTFLGKGVEITVTVESIDKQGAEVILANPYEQQRNLNKPLIDRMVQAMNAGEYIEAIPNPICISETGKLLDGQHRLTAVTQTNRKIQFLVAYGLPNNSFVYFDQNRPRTLIDALNTNRVSNAGKLAPATKLLYQLIAGNQNAPRNEVALRMIQDYPPLEGSVTYAESISYATHITTSVGAVLHFLYTMNYPESCSTFFDILRHGDREIFKTPRHPITILAKKLNEEWKKLKTGRRYDAVPSSATYGGHGEFESRHLLLSWIHQAFMAYQNGKRSLRWEPIGNTPIILSEIGSMARQSVLIRHEY